MRPVSASRHQRENVASPTLVHRLATGAAWLLMASGIAVTVHFLLRVPSIELNPLALLRGSTAARPAAIDLLLVLGCPIASLLLYLCSWHAKRHRNAAGRAAQNNGRALKYSEARFAALVHLATDAIVVVDRRQRILDFNPGAERLFRTSAATAIGMRLSHFLPQRLHRARRTLLKARCHTPIDLFRIDRHQGGFAVRSNGERFPFSATAFRSGNRDTVTYTILFTELNGDDEPSALATTPDGASSAGRSRCGQPPGQRWQPVHSVLGEARRQLHSRIMRLDRAREEQQKRLAREMHDDFGQLLTAMKMDVISLQTRLEQVDANLARQLDGIDGLINAMVVSVRRIMTDLPPQIIAQHGLFKALELLADGHSRRHQVAVNLHLPATPTELPDEIATPVYRMAQEALNNIAKHAVAATVELQLRLQDDALHLSIADDGQGIAVDAADNPGCSGLVGMRERVSALQGAMQIRSAPGNGTTIQISIPIRATPADHPTTAPSDSV
ncbi:PAS domain S-box-containing protein [Actimicrobium sp. GrIS 1.19]|uniref:PAS domain-containing sensor histidine kinase n=1 Tax=Actimicrobium sp. GrIS 1.19 TaxID=3071708 RepID=UPI002E01FF66|nr:PAS domain S-box-containing protein [Actimicrobium sp. GrIS 1.19]